MDKFLLDKILTTANSYYLYKWADHSGLLPSETSAQLERFDSRYERADSCDDRMREACEAGYIDLVEETLESGGDINEGFIASAGKGHLHCVVLLHSRGADKYYEALHAAMSKGHFDCFKYVCDNTHLPTAYFDCLLDLLDKNNVECFEYMLRYDIDLDEALVWTSCSFDGNIEMIDRIISLGGQAVYHSLCMAMTQHRNINAAHLVGKTKELEKAFKSACSGGNLECVKMFIGMGVGTAKDALLISSRCKTVDDARRKMVEGPPQFMSYNRKCIKYLLTVV